MDLTHISLFTGIGGFDLSAEWAGFRTVLQCEIDPFCQAVLRKHFPGVPIIEDVHDVTREKVGQVVADTESIRMRRWGNGWSEIREPDWIIGNGKNGIHRKPITLLTAGVPCQPASTAGKRRGKADNRWLWPQAIRVLHELQPAWAVFENPSGIISLDEHSSVVDVESEAVNQIPDEYSAGLDELCGQIEKAGYSVQPILIPACAVNAYHRRDRVFIIAHAANNGQYRNDTAGILQGKLSPNIEQFRDRGASGFTGHGETSPDSQKQGLEGRIAERGICAERLPAELLFNPATEGLPDWAGGEMGQPSPLTECERPDGEREIECEFRVLADGLSERILRPVRNRVSQLKAYGNAVVPAQCYPILKAIADIEREVNGL